MKLLSKSSWVALGKASFFLTLALVISHLFKFGSLSDNIGLWAFGIATGFLTLRFRDPIKS